MSTTATGTLAEAWADRAYAAVATLQHAAVAPALFKPEHVEQVQDDAAKAEAQYRYWRAQDVTR